MTMTSEEKWDLQETIDFLKAENLLAQQHIHGTRTLAAHQDEVFWKAHDANAGGGHYGPYALCERCRKDWKQWRDDRAAERLAAIERGE